MAEDELGYSVRNRVAVLEINRPDRMNAWTPGLEAALRTVLTRADSDPDVRCAVLTGTGRAFCAGADMDAMRLNQQVPANVTSGEDTGQRYGFIWTFGKPLIAAINGAAAGVGMCLALYCDIRYVAAGAKLTLPYSRRGLVAEHGTAWLLPRLVGPMHAADLLLSGRTFLAEEAGTMGLATVLPASGFLDAVLAKAADIANATSPRSTRIIKRQIFEARYQTFAQATRLADAEIDRCRPTHDFREGVAHFLEKRAPAFTGS